MSRASFCCNKIVRNLHLFFKKVAVIVAFAHKHFKWYLFTQAIYLKIMLNISRHYLARNSNFFANSLRSMLKLRSTLHEVAWQFNNLVCSSGLIFSRVISTIVFRSLFSSNRSSKRTELYWNSFKACFLNRTFTICAILNKSCSKKLHVEKKKVAKSCNLKFL